MARCLVEGCEREGNIGGYCFPHNRKRPGQDPYINFGFTENDRMLGLSPSSPEWWTPQRRAQVSKSVKESLSRKRDEGSGS